MVRTQIYLEESQKSKMEKICENLGISLGELIRQSIDELLKKKVAVDFKGALENTYGLWKNRKDIGQGSLYVRWLREEWHNRGKRLLTHG